MWSFNGILHVLFRLLWTIFAAHPPTNPTRTACPQGGLPLRFAGDSGCQRLSPQEASYIHERTSHVLPTAWKNYLHNVERAAPKGNLFTDFLPGNSRSIPRIGIAISGGAHRGALFGAGVLSSIDARNETAVKRGTAGLLQSATYTSALSGGEWLSLSMAQADFPTIPDLIFPPNPNPNGGENQFGGWLTTIDLIEPGDTNTTLLYLETLLEEVLPKVQAGFPLTIADMWARTLARHFINGTNLENIFSIGGHGAGILLSQFTELSTFRAYEQPFLIILATSVPPNPDPSKILVGHFVPLNSEIIEFSSFEVGSYDPTLSFFIPTSLLGSTANNCVIGFDQAGYIASTSSSVFLVANVTGEVSALAPFVELIEAAVGPQPNIRLDSAVIPNAFEGLQPDSFSSTNETFINLGDGGLAGENIPFYPLLVQPRDVDTIIAIDASADTFDNFANGSSVINSAKRAALFGDTYPFPSVPDSANIFVEEGLNLHPTFFGCDEYSNNAPLIIYIANGGSPVGQVPVTNASTSQSTFSDAEVQQILDQSFQIATQGRPGTHWGTCLACGVSDRTRARLGLPRTPECEFCMEKYCWYGH